MFDEIFKNAVVAGVPLLAFVIGLVQYIKGFGLQGAQVRIASMVTGIVLGFGYQLSIAIPATFADWFSVLVFGLALGLTASGIFEVANPPKS